MSAIVFSVVMALLLTGYYISKRKRTSRVFIQCVEAGPTSISNAEELRRKSFYDKDTVMRGLNGEILSSTRYARILVNGTCMRERNIHDGDILIAELFDAEKDLCHELKSGEIVWLHIEDSGIDKIRVFDGWDGDELKTYYYKDGMKHPSSSNHLKSQVRGIVRYNTNR